MPPHALCGNVCVRLRCRFNDTSVPEVATLREWWVFEGSSAPVQAVLTSSGKLFYARMHPPAITTWSRIPKQSMWGAFRALTARLFACTRIVCAMLLSRRPVWPF